MHVCGWSFTNIVVSTRAPWRSDVEPSMICSKGVRITAWCCG